MPYKSYRKKPYTRSYRKKQSNYQKELNRIARPPGRAAFKTGNVSDTYRPASGGVVYRTFIGSFDTSSVEYLSGISVKVLGTIAATDAMTYYIAVIDILRSTMVDGWVSGLPLEIFGATSQGGYQPQPDINRVRVLKSVQRMVRVSDQTVSGTSDMKLWVPIRTWIGRNKKGAVMPHNQFKLVVVQKSVREWSTNHIATTDISTKMYFRNI